MSKTQQKGAVGAKTNGQNKSGSQIIPAGSLEINVTKIEAAAELFKAVAHHVRLKIIKLIEKEKRVNVNVIYRTLELEQSITSQHLKSLREVGAVLTERESKKIYYSLNYDRFHAINEAIKVLEG
ncbi:MAG: metalloregulator ArsR/SmtB family transcription factor [Chitinophagales bacterium]